MKENNYLVPLLLLGMLCISYSAFAKCTDQRDVPDAAVSQLDTWDKLHDSYLKYGDCGVDGGLAEIYSDEIEKLFTTDWQHIGRLAELAKKDKGFETFVVDSHIDITWSPEGNAALTKNVKKHCPPDAARLCRRIKKRLGEIEQEVKEDTTRKKPKAAR